MFNKKIKANDMFWPNQLRRISNVPLNNLTKTDKNNLIYLAKQAPDNQILIISILGSLSIKELSLLENRIKQVSDECKNNKAKRLNQLNREVHFVQREKERVENLKDNEDWWKNYRASKQLDETKLKNTTELDVNF